MGKFAFCAGYRQIWQFDTANPAQLPFVVHNGESDITSIAFSADQQFELAWGGETQIRKTQGMNIDLPVYSLPPAENPTVFISKVRLRTVDGQERVYFSVADMSQGTQNRFKIYYLKNGTATLYRAIDINQVTVPNPCATNPPEIPFYGGDFDFGDADTLYLSSGNLGPVAGIYRIDGAGPDAATGTVQRIYVSDGPIGGLCHHSPQTLYFLRGTSIYKLYLPTLTESLEGTLTSLPPVWGVGDLAEIGNGFPHPFYLPILSQVHRSLAAGAQFVLRVATQTFGRSPPKPHPVLSDAAKRHLGVRS